MDRLNGLLSVTCSSETEEGRCINVTNGVSRRVRDESNCWISGPVGEAGEWIMLNLPEKTEIGEVHLKFDPNLSKEIMPTLSDLKKKEQAAGIPIELVKDYRVELLDGEM